ncbi:MAG: hypothetical protein OQJ77_07480, partial [Thiovulaceae bacterium]|nr:hypothetical protein [Sulfurimonadaceae bacterium]
STLIVQEPFECEKADSIVSKAIENGSYDFKFLTKEIISYLNIISINKSKDEWIEYLLDEVHNIHGYDFKLYGLNYVERRIEAFMKKNIIKTYKVFVLKVLYDKVCFKSFFLDLSINITCFFRSIESSKRMLNLLKYHKNSYNIKIWSAGCSSGKEAYSTAVLLDELNLLDKSVIYATDFNDIIIQEAKNGLYSIDSFVKAKEEHKKLGLIKPIEDYFILHGDYVEISKKLSEKVMFFVHNLENDSAFNEFSVIECKNVLIYFNEELQRKVIKLFYDSLKFGGHLFLGPSERLPSSFMNKFKVCSDKYKVYRKVS